MKKSKPTKAWGIKVGNRIEKCAWCTKDLAAPHINPYPHIKTASAVGDAKLREIIGEAIGQASMCWKPYPTGVFDSTKASEIVDGAVGLLRTAQRPTVPQEALRLLKDAMWNCTTSFGAEKDMARWQIEQALSLLTRGNDQGGWR